VSAEREVELADPPTVRLPDLGGAVEDLDIVETEPMDRSFEVVVPSIGPTSQVLDVARAALGTSVIRLLRHDAGVRSGNDHEDVHQARVATRRLRSDLRSFREVFEPGWANDLRVELGWLGAQLGAVRDTDVLIDRLRASAAELPGRDAVVAERILGRLAARRDEARTVLIAAMRSARYRELLDRLVAASAEPLVRSAAAAGSTGRDSTSVLAGVMRQPWARLRAAMEALGPDASDAELHEARIRAKRLRYAAEAVAPVFGNRARGFARAATELQRVLGEHQDSVVASAWLRDVAASGAPTAFVAGELAAAEHAAAAAARAAWPTAWKALARKRLRFWT
jgi:CHAD domain-containing protein